MTLNHTRHEGTTIAVGHSSIRTRSQISPGHALSIMRNSKSKETHHSADFIPGVHHMREGQDTADARGDVGAIVATVINVMELTNQFQLESSISDDLAPDLNVVSIPRKRHNSEANASEVLDNGNNVH